MTRKYRQPGYQDEERREERPQHAPRKGPRDPSAPRSPKMPGFLTVFRCAMCGASATGEEAFGFDAQCSKCSAALHSCKNCVHFDPNSRFECTEPVEARIPKKDARNECTFFETRTRVEKEITTAMSGRRPAAAPTDDPRAAFERLFKK
ncbi:MAG: hypothetical protein HY315_01045 [Acidobacteria bacterium]|nr:hypothetical protein [Acidobacteriota bacterium]